MSITANHASIAAAGRRSARPSGGSKVRFRGLIVLGMALAAWAPIGFVAYQMI
jgi:hypothetical protein